MCYGNVQHRVSFKKKLQELLEYDYEDFKSLDNT